MHPSIIFLSILVNLIVCRDFYVGMFKRNDFLVAQDRLYKEKVYYSKVTAKYGRVFKCPITYLRVADRLGISRGPTVEIIRGGLLRNFVVLRLRSAYNCPISVNIYVGCENKMAREITVVTTGSTISGISKHATSVTSNATDSKITGKSENATSKVVTTTAGSENATSEVVTTTDGTITGENATLTTTPEAPNNVTMNDGEKVNNNSTNGNKTT